MGSEFSTNINKEENTVADSLSDLGIARTEYDDTYSFNCFSSGSSSHSRGMVGGLFGEIIGSDNFKSPTFKIVTDTSFNNMEMEFLTI